MYTAAVATAPVIAAATLPHIYCSELSIFDLITSTWKIKLLIMMNTMNIKTAGNKKILYLGIKEDSKNKHDKISIMAMWHI